MAFGKAHQPVGFTPSLLSALGESLLVFLFNDNFYYNSNLWTMREEFIGSLIVFAIASASITRAAQTTKGFVIILHVVLILSFSFFHFTYVEFVVGSAISYLYSRRRAGFQMSGPMMIALVIVSVVGYSSPNAPCLTVSSIAVILILLGRESLSKHMSGRIGTALGVISFPLYLVHTL